MVKFRVITRRELVVIVCPDPMAFLHHCREILQKYHTFAACLIPPTWVIEWPLFFLVCRGAKCHTLFLQEAIDRRRALRSWGANLKAAKNLRAVGRQRLPNEFLKYTYLRIHEWYFYLFYIFIINNQPFMYKQIYRSSHASVMGDPSEDLHVTWKGTRTQKKNNLPVPAF